MTHVLIVEDEPLIARRIERMIRDILGDRLKRIDCAPDLDSAMARIRSGDITLLLLDLNLSGQDGFDVLHRAVAESFDTIVVSANTDRAIEAFELGVIDFVPKPFTADRLAKALDRVALRNSQESRIRFLAVSLAGRIELVPIASVIAVHGDDDYSSIETLDGRRHLHRKTLASLERLLPGNFERVHRSHIVNLLHVESILTPAAGGRAVRLANGTLVPVGRSYAKALAARSIG
jgi:DNA-binding LytR/AlgR family response regulator